MITGGKLFQSIRHPGVLQANVFQSWVNSFGNQPDTESGFVCGLGMRVIGGLWGGAPSYLGSGGPGH